MRIVVEGLALEVRPGVPASAVVAFARAHGVELPERPWCGPARLLPEHPVGKSPLVEFSRLSSAPGPDARPRPGVHLAVVSGPDAGAVATLSDGLVVGRAADAGLRLADPAVSGRHARIAGSTVRDEGSTNGTRVAGARIRGRHALAPGQLIELGGTGVMLHDPHAQSATELPGTPFPRGAATLLAGGASMALFAVMTGHWTLAIAALAVPGAALGMSRLRANRRLPPAPVLDVTGTLGLPPLPPGAVCVRGSRELVRAVTLTTGRPPHDAPHWEPWMELLPRAQREVHWRGDDDDPPSWTEVVVSQAAHELVIVAHGTTVRSPLPLVTVAHADASARRIASAVARSALPESVAWAELPAPSPRGLRVRLGVDATGPVPLDLVGDGPHVLVAGTTGSGKSEALRTIVCSLAHDYSPREVIFALIDFKGGAGLGPCARLPHVASVLTDLEPHLARRCLLALGAELAARKRASAAAGARAYEDWVRPPPRLVVVVDEFQEISAVDRDFLPELTRLAAQGRSLGIHLVLATQRPAGAVSADIRANISTIIALRTASPAESRDLVGSPAAAEIPAELPGRAVLSRGAASPQLVQIALPIADPPPPVRLADDRQARGRALDEVAAHRHQGRATALWLDPLPEHVSPPAGGGFQLGVADRPARREREAVEWEPAAGPYVVAGPPGSGRTSALLAVAALGTEQGLTPIWVPREPRRAARTLAIAADHPRPLVLIDDAERMLTAAAMAEPEASELLAACVRRGAAALVVPPSWANHRLVAAAGVVALLTGLSAPDDAAWNVPAELRQIARLPGRARVRRADGWAEAQLAMAPRFAPPAVVAELPRTVSGSLPLHALGVGGDDAAPVLLPQSVAAVVGPAGDERDTVARRVAAASGHEPIVVDSGMLFGMPGHESPRTIVCVRPSSRSLREVMRERAVGLIEPSPVPLRVVAIVDGRAVAVQVLPA